MEILLAFILAVCWLPEFGEILRWNCGAARRDVRDEVSDVWLVRSEILCHDGCYMLAFCGQFKGGEHRDFDTGEI